MTIYSLAIDGRQTAVSTRRSYALVCVRGAAYTSIAGTYVPYLNVEATSDSVASLRQRARHCEPGLGGRVAIIELATGAEIGVTPAADAAATLTREMEQTARAVRDNPSDALAREQFTELMLRLSLCPLHKCDYAICFDDETPECAAIRTIHPRHDT